MVLSSAGARGERSRGRWLCWTAQNSSVVNRGTSSSELWPFRPARFPAEHIGGAFAPGGRTPILQLTMIDQMSRAELTELLRDRFRQAPGKALAFSLVGFINKRLIPVVLKAAGFSDLKQPVGELTSAETERLSGDSDELADGGQRDKLAQRPGDGWGC